MRVLPFPPISMKFLRKFSGYGGSADLENRTFRNKLFSAHSHSVSGWPGTSDIWQKGSWIYLYLHSLLGAGLVYLVFQVLRLTGKSGSVRTAIPELDVSAGTNLIPPDEVWGESPICPPDERGMSLVDVADVRVTSPSLGAFWAHLLIIPSPLQGGYWGNNCRTPKALFYLFSHLGAFLKLLLYFILRMPLCLKVGHNFLNIKSYFKCRLLH